MNTVAFAQATTPANESGQARGNDIERIVNELRWIPQDLEMTILKPRLAKAIMAVAGKSDDLKPLLSTSSTDQEKSVALLVLGWADNPKYVSMVGDRLEDKRPALPLQLTPQGIQQMFDYSHGNVETRKQTQGDLAMRVISMRCGCSAPRNYLHSSKAFRAYWSSIPNAEELPSEWVFAFRKAIAWHRSVKDVKVSLSKLESPARPIIEAIVYLQMPNDHVYAEQDVVKELAGVDPKILRGLMDGSWRLPGMTLPTGPNSKDQQELKAFVLANSPQFFKTEDAQWLYDMAMSGGMPFSDYVIGAAQVDPSKGFDWLKMAAEKEGLQNQRTRLLLAVWQTQGANSIKYLTDRYYDESKPEYNIGGLQEEFIQKLSLRGKASVPLLVAIIRDKRFMRLGWTATRMFAEHAELLFGEKPRQAKNYLSVDHPLGVYDYERRPAMREKFPSETKRVVVATKEFQEFLLKEMEIKLPT
jgi:hypothetical protein